MATSEEVRRAVKLLKDFDSWQAYEEHRKTNENPALTRQDYQEQIVAAALAVLEGRDS